MFSNWARAAICWAKSVVCMPWNSPSSQPTSWAWATLSSASLGGVPLSFGEGQRQPFQLVDQLGRQTVLKLLDGALVDLLEALAAGLVQRSRADLLEQLANHAADAHHLGRLFDQVGDGPLPALLLTLDFLGTHDHDVRSALLSVHNLNCTSRIFPMWSPVSMIR